MSENDYPHGLSDAAIDIIAERAAEKAIQKVYEQIGKSVAQKIFWFIGVAVVGVMILMAGNGILKQ
jgi:hypothetical protein